MEHDNQAEEGKVPFVLKPIPQVKHLNFYFSSFVVSKDLLVRLPLPMPDAIKVFGVWSNGIPRFEVGKIALDVA